MDVDKKILSIDSDDESVDIKSFTIFMEDNTKRNKNKSANDFMEIGEDLLAEVEAKKVRQEQEKKKCIKYIPQRRFNFYCRQGFYISKGNL